MAFCEGIPPVTCGFPSRGTSIDVANEQTVELPVVWDATTFMGCHRRAKFASRPSSCQITATHLEIGTSRFDLLVRGYQMSYNISRRGIALWRHRMETFSALLALCEGHPSVTGGFSSQRPVTRSFDVFLDLRVNKRLNKQSRCRWFETLLWRHAIMTSL